MDVKANEDSVLSDEDIYFGEICLKEIKRQIFCSRKTIGHVNEYPELAADTSLKIIEATSEPSLVSKNENVINYTNSTDFSISEQVNHSNFGTMTSDDSSFKIENWVGALSEMSESVDTVSEDECNNTLEEIDRILEKGKNKNNSNAVKIIPQIIIGDVINSDGFNTVKTSDNTDINSQEKLKYIIETTDESKIGKNSQQSVSRQNYLAKTPEKEAVNDYSENDESPFATPLKAPEETIDHFKTPSTKINRELLFKTPLIHNFKKPTNTASAKKTPMKSTNIYEHISSPVALYINNSPQVPLIKNVKPPKKGFPGPSSIPKYIKPPTSTQVKLNKENINLPSVAYRTAKETKVTQLPEPSQQHLKSHSAKKLLSSLPRPMVIKHEHRENAIKSKAKCGQDSSFANLSLYQADVSLCTQKLAITTPTKSKK